MYSQIQVTQVRTSKKYISKNKIVTKIKNPEAGTELDLHSRHV
jgi:hypothetical protein